MHISHIIFLIHPCCYEPIEAEQIKLEGLQLYLDREQEVKTRWLAEISAGAAGTMFVQLGGPVYLTQAAEKTLQPGCAVSLQFPFPESQDLHTYYEGLSTEIRSHLQAHRLELNQATVTSELWGESFEGCVPGYGGAFAQHLGLQTSPRMRYEMTVFDSRFLHLARRVDTLPIGSTDVEAWLFECHDGTCAATFQARRTAQWLDERCVAVTLHDRRHQLTDKLGHAVWPETPWEKGKHETEQQVSVPLKDWVSRWVRGIHTDFDTFRSVIGTAYIC
jgi:hypothetical protein